MTPEEAERLEMLAEEAAEVIKIVMKTLRHGYESYHPDYPEVTNRQLLEQEAGDFLGILAQMEQQEDVQAVNIAFHKQEKWKKSLQYTHHQSKE